MEQTSRRIKILHITFNMGIGGTEQVIRQLVSQLRSTDIGNEILCIDGAIGPVGQSLQEDGIEVGAVKRSPGFDRQLIRSIRKHIRAGGYQIVHCHQYTPFLYGRLAAMGTGARVVFTEHGRFHPDRYRYKAALINPVLAWSTSAIVAISAATRRALARYEFMPAGRIRLIYNGIEGLSRNPAGSAAVRRSLGIPADAFVVGTVSRLDGVKNQRMMIRAFRRVLGQCPDAYLLMVGDGPEREALARLCASLDVAHRVVFTGFIPAPADHLAAMDIFLLSSYTEGTSMTLLEAMSLGIPAVATRVGGNPEIVAEGETGLLVTSDDDADFAEAMVRIRRNPALYEALSRNSRSRFDQHFTVAKMVNQYLGLYKHILRS